MATDAERSMEMIKKSFAMFADDMQKTDKASKGVAKNVGQLVTQLRGTPKTISEVLGEVIKLPKPLRELSHALVTPHEDLKKAVSMRKDELNAVRFTNQAAAAYHAQLLKVEEKRLHLKEQIEKITGKEIGAEYLLIRGLMEAVQRSGEINRAQIQANSLSSVRQSITEDIYNTQIATGASLQTMLDASKSLTAVWPKTRTDFRSTLDLVVKMEQGLGVSFEHSVELARTFQIGLKTPVREVADQIAIIANSTSLAADEAARLATEIGKSLRLLGPGAATGAREVTGYVAAMAARMKDVGGDAGDIVKMFTEMQRGTSQGFMLRGFSGVTAGGTGTQAGAQAAFKGIGRVIDSIVSAKPGTDAYAAQLEAASQVLGITTDSVVLYNKMLAESKKPLDEHAKLQQRWSEQVTNANTALHRVRESFIALVQKALLPAMPAISGVLNGIAKFVSWIGQSRVAIVTTTVILGAIAVKTTLSLFRLSAALMSVAVNSELAARMQAARGITGGVEGGGLFGRIGVSLLNFFKNPNLFAPLGTTFLASLKAAFRVGPLAAIAASAAAGYGLGKLAEMWSPNNWISKLATAIGVAYEKAMHKQQYAAIGHQATGGKDVWRVMNDIRTAALRGNMDEAFRIFQENKYQVKGLRGEKGAQAYLDRFVETMADVRERTALSTVTVSERDTLRNDEHLIELTKQLLANSSQYLKDMRDWEQRKAGRDDLQRQHAEKLRMINDANSRLWREEERHKASSIPVLR